MASTIGTNIVSDENELFDMIQKIQDIWGKLIQDKNHDKYKEMIKNLGDYVGKGGTLVFASIPTKYTQKFEEMLRNNDIDYMLLPTADGMSIAVKDKDKEKFYELQDTLFKTSADFYAELTDVNGFADYCRSIDKAKNLDIPVLSFDENEVRLIVQNKMAANGVLPVYDDRNQKVYTFPDKLFSTNGDLVDSLYAAGIDLARCEVSEKFTKIKGEQLRYDRQVVNDFVTNMLNGKSCTIASTVNGKDLRISVNDKGDLTITENGKIMNQLMHDGPELQNAFANEDRTSLFALVSATANNINNMALFMDESNIENYRNKKTMTEYINTRPKQEGIGYALSEMGKDLDVILNHTIVKVNAEIKKHPKYNILTQKQLMNLKRNRIAEILLNEELNSIKEFFNKDYETIKIKHSQNIFDTEEEKSTVLNKEFKKKLIKGIINSCDDVLGNSSKEVNINFVNQRELEEELAKEETKDMYGKREENRERDE